MISIDPEFKNQFAAMLAEIAKTPETARAFLQEIGIIDTNGVLSERYGGPKFFEIAHCSSIDRKSRISI